MLSIQMVKARWRTLVGTFIALALGVGLLSATAVVIASATAQPPERLVKAQILVSSPQAGKDDAGFPEFRPWSHERARELVDQLRDTSGVKEAVSDYAFHAQLFKNNKPVGSADIDDPQGHGWSSLQLSPYRLSAGAAPRGTQDVVLAESVGVQPGERVRIQTATGITSMTVSGTVSGPGIYVSDELASQLSSGVRALGIITSEPVDAVAKDVRKIVAGDGTVLTGLDRAKLEAEADTRDRFVGQQLLGTMAVLSGFVSIFVVATTFAFTVTQRRREIGLLRAIGATPGQVRRMLLGEALAVGAVASIVGAGIGSLVAPVLGHWMVEAGMQSASFRPHSYALPLAISVFVGLLVSLLGVWTASRRASKVPPLQAMRDATAERRPMTLTRWVTGVGGIAVGIVLGACVPMFEAEGTAGAAAGAVVFMIIGMTMLAPLYVPWLVRLACWPLRRSAGSTVELVREGSVTGVRRVASTIGPVLLTVGFAVLVTGQVETMDHAYGQGNDEVPTAVVVRPDKQTFGLSDDALSTVDKARPARLLATLPTSIYVDGDRWETAGIDDTDHKTADGSLGALDGESIGLSATTARAHDLQVGETVQAMWADGKPVTLTVVAISPDGVLPAPVVVSRETARAHDANAVTPIAYLDGIDPEAVNGSLAKLGAKAVTKESFHDASNAEEERLLRLFVLVLLGLALTFTMLSIANTLVMATGERRRDFAVLRLAGAHIRQVLRVVVAEAVLVVSIGGILGLLVALPGVWGMASGLADEFDTDVSMRLSWSTLLAVVAVCMAIAALSSAIAARSTMRADAHHLAANRE